ncbi:MAG: hypothetical protein NTV14_06985 [Coprothermobacterota bacterium]|nr:hypothetical protein [Coprothermobacterota bacterium]
MNSPPLSLSIPRPEKGVLARIAWMAVKLIARGDLHRAEGIDEVPRGGGTAMLDQVHLQEAELSGFPAIQFDGDLLLQLFSAGVVKDLPDLSQSSHHLAVVAGFALLRCFFPR